MTLQFYILILNIVYVLSAFIKLSAHLVCGKRKEGKKGNLLLCYLD